ncbi:MAG: hypothetical protein ACLQDY_16815, partial [Streptosporangiaceae bacterium]
MSIRDEQELRARLHGALDPVTPPPAPVGAAIRQGRAIRRRRQAAVAIAAAVLTAAAVIIPQLVHLPARQPASPRPPVVKVHPPGRGAPAGQISWGTINGRHWQVSAQQPAGGYQCFDFSGNRCPEYVQASVLGPAGSPASFQNDGPFDGTQYAVGSVRRDVARLRVVLQDGTVLTLRPVPRYGRRWVAFAVPGQLAVAKIIA